MDISQLNSRSASDTAKPMHLRHPSTGKPMYDGGDLDKPCLVFIRGVESNEVQKIIRAANQERMKNAKDEDGDDENLLAVLHERTAKNMVPLIVGFENLERGDRPLQANEDDILYFLNAQLMTTGDKEDYSFLAQVSRFATDRSNYLGNG